MYLQRYALKYICFPLETPSKLYCCFLFGLVLFVPSPFICKGRFSLEERRDLLFKEQIRLKCTYENESKGL